MKNPFKKKKADPKEWQNELLERDWNSLTLIHHILFAEPDLLTVPGAYPRCSDTDYDTIEQWLRQQMGQIEVSTNCAALCDQAIRLRTLQIQNRLLSQRLLHYREAVRLRTDAELHLHQMQERLCTLKAAYAALEAEHSRLLNA